MPRTIFYYQTFKNKDDKLISLDPVLYENTPLTHIHVSSIHFGVDVNKEPYIHLNNRSPYNSYFDEVWDNIEYASSKNIKIVLMVGGAGGGYNSLFSNISMYYDLLYTLLKDKPFISGIDLDIEESCSLENVQLLISKIVKDFGETFIIATAPVASSLINDGPGMGGFSYKDLLNSPEGSYIDYFNCQAYYNYSLKTLDSIVKNGYDPKKIVMGLIAGETYESELQDMYEKYKDNFGGLFVWEYFNTVPSAIQWCQFVESVFNHTRHISNFCLIS
tara:strand:- start:794 stop:1618 length:825 start_codon:yes stop_codon:yes gene_type:complete